MERGGEEKERRLQETGTKHVNISRILNINNNNNVKKADLKFKKKAV